MSIGTPGVPQKTGTPPPVPLFGQREGDPARGLQPGADAERALASIASGGLAHMGITPERTQGRDYDRDFGPSR